MTDPTIEPQLRDYQTLAISEIYEALKQYRHVCYQLQTGGGKTVIAGEIIRRAHGRERRVLFLVHRRELIGQAIATFRKHLPNVQVGVEAAGWPQNPWAPIQIGMVQTIYRRQLNFAPNLIIIDECHHARAKTWSAVINRWPDAFRIGLTATPQRLDGRGLGATERLKDGTVMPPIFRRLVQGPSLSELVELGWLAPVRVLAQPAGIDLTKLMLNSRGTDYRDRDLTEAVNAKVVASAADAYDRHAAGRSAIFFGIDRRHSRMVAEALRDLGYRAEHVDGEDHASRRDRIMDGLRTGQIDVVCNCQLISEGFDAPGCDTVILGRPTKSVPMYLQQVGRCLRPGEDKQALILDLGGSVHELGLPTDRRTWTLADGNTRPPYQGPLIKTCRNCRTVFRAPPCPHCGWAPGTAQLHEVAVDLEEIKQVKRRSDRGKRAGRGHLSRAELRRRLAIAFESPDPRKSLGELQREQGYHPKFVDRMMRLGPPRRRERSGGDSGNGGAGDDLPVLLT